MPDGLRPVFWLSPLADRTDHRKAGRIDVVQRSRTGPSNVRSRAGVFGGFSCRMGTVFPIALPLHRGRFFDRTGSASVLDLAEVYGGVLGRYTYSIGRSDRLKKRFSQPLIIPWSGVQVPHALPFITHERFSQPFMYPAAGL